MSIEETDLTSDGYDRLFFDLSSKLTEPFCWAYGMVRYRSISPLDPGKFDNSTSRIKEVATRMFIFLSAATAFVFAATHILIVAAVMGSLAKIFQAAGFYVQKNQFTHVRSDAPEKALDKGQISVMTWNICGEFGGLHYREGGVIHWRSRIDQIVENIKKEDPDVIVLQEIYDTALSEAIIDRLKDQYVHFFTHMRGSGCMVITKCNVQHFSYSDQDKTEEFAIKANPQDALPCVRFYGTQLDRGEEAKQKRMDKVTQIVEAFAKETLALPTFMIMNNADRDCPVEGVHLSKFLHHSYRGEVPTHTDQLVKQWDPKLKDQESFHFISLFKRNIPDGRTLPVIEKGIRMIDCHLVEAYDETYNTQKALSNSHGVVTVIGGLKRS